VLVTHLDEQRKGDEIIERLDVQGGSRGEIYKAADAMGRIVIRDGRRWLHFSPTDTAYGKNPGQLEPLEIPSCDQAPQFLADVVQRIKNRLNTLTAEQTEWQQRMERWRLSIADLDDVAAFNAALPEAEQQPKAIKALFAQAAKAKGYVFDKKTRIYVQQMPFVARVSIHAIHLHARRHLRADESNPAA